MPATTVNSLVSPRQQRFIAALADERILTPQQRNLAASAAEGQLSSRSASQLISDALEMPRRDARRATASTSRSDGTVMPTPSQTTRSGRMLLAGGIEATVTLSSGEHVTLTVRTRRPQGRGWTNAAPTEEGARTTISAFGRRIGWANVEDGAWKVTLRTRNANAVIAVSALFQYAADDELPALVTVQEASRCGRCMRRLTDPVSIARGVGPECFGRATSSRAADVNDIPRGHAVNVDMERGTVTPVEPRLNREHSERVAAEREAAHDRAFAIREREQEERAFASDPDFRAHQERVRRNPELGTTGVTPSLTEVAANAASPVLTRDSQRARDLIAEALDAYCSDTDRDFAMRTFDQLAAR